MKPLSQHAIDLSREADDAEWFGDMERADRLKAELVRVRERIEAGELWEVPF